jgi:hypothetical protein
LIGEIVGHAEKSIKRAHGKTLGARQEAESQVKISRLALGRPLAIAVRVGKVGWHERL